ncbi:D-alanyl-lipoteichoic acid biosynthesis protein DltD [Sporolactobacillus sp. KGMB 08714]|uniref:D-alanyl-lipoteichoic acid biosynthesis protein DltD n=1 Tax=Sporolactobacillus sp. KGMB 08714 TaxID=3064704 RepID=UPI002FBE4FDB
MKAPRFGPMILAVVLVYSLVFAPPSVKSLSISRSDVSRAASTLDPTIFQGTLMQQKMLKDKQYLPIYGSSELHRLDIYHPTNFFKINFDGFTPFLIGRAGMYSLIHFLNLAANADLLKNRKIVIILSPEWFTQKGLSTSYFAGNFSEEQMYQFIFSSNIDPKLKQKAARRFLQFGFIRQNGAIAPLLEKIAYPNKTSGTSLFVDSLQGRMNEHMLTLYDAIRMQRIRPNYYQSQYQRPDPKLKGKSWSQLKLMAKEDVASYTNSNPFHISNALYLKSIKNRLIHFKNYNASQSFNTSPEYGDLQLVLDLLKEKHAKALFVSVPFNGLWYNYAGVSRQKREICYRNIAREIRGNGFQLADFTRFDSTPYFLEDTMHIGPEGWVYIDQAIQSFYDQKT